MQVSSEHTTIRRKKEHRSGEKVTRTGPGRMEGQGGGDGARGERWDRERRPRDTAGARKRRKGGQKGSGTNKAGSDRFRRKRNHSGVSLREVLGKGSG